MKWRAPPEWKGQTVVVMASGPSITQAHAEACRGLKTIVVNNAYQLAPWADVLYFCDERWIDIHPGAWKFTGLKVSLTDDRVLKLENGGESGIDTRPTHLRTGRNSGYQALNLAVLFGAARILLFGFDMKHKGKTHFFGRYPSSLERQHPYQVWIKHFNQAAPILKGMGVEVWNCTDSALTCFEKKDYRDALQEVRRTKEEGAEMAALKSSGACFERGADHDVRQRISQGSRTTEHESATAHRHGEAPAASGPASPAP